MPKCDLVPRSVPRSVPQSVPRSVPRSAVFLPAFVGATRGHGRVTDLSSAHTRSGICIHKAVAGRGGEVWAVGCGVMWVGLRYPLGAHGATCTVVDAGPISSGFMVHFGHFIAGSNTYPRMCILLRLFCA